jgi:hypothetical protein
MVRLALLSNKQETKMSNQFAVPTIRIKADTAPGFAVINRDEFDHDEHELFDKKDAPLVPARSKKVITAEAPDIEELRKQLGEANNRVLEAESERDEWRARAEAAETKLGGEKPKAK